MPQTGSRNGGVTGAGGMPTDGTQDGQPDTGGVVADTCMGSELSISTRRAGLAWAGASSFLAETEQHEKDIGDARLARGRTRCTRRVARVATTFGLAVARSVL